MKKLEINITKATLKSFAVSINDGDPQIDATIALLTEGGKLITTYSISTNSWNQNNKFELPLEAMAPAGQLAHILEEVVVKHCRDSQFALGDGEMLEEIPF